MVMCEPQKVEIDCRKSSCVFNNGRGYCCTRPTITLNENNLFYCWTYKKNYKELKMNQLMSKEALNFVLQINEYQLYYNNDYNVRLIKKSKPYEELEEWYIVKNDNSYLTKDICWQLKLSQNCIFKSASEAYNIYQKFFDNRS